MCNRSAAEPIDASANGEAHSKLMQRDGSNALELLSIESDRTHPHKKLRAVKHFMNTKTLLLIELQVETSAQEDCMRCLLKTKKRNT